MLISWILLWAGHVKLVKYWKFVVFCRKNWRDEIAWKMKNVYRMILKWILEKSGGRCGADLFDPRQGWDQWHALLKTVVNLRFSWKWGNSWLSARLSGLCSMKMAVFWVVAPCKLVWVCQRFGSLYCVHHQGSHRQSTRRYNPEGGHFHTHHCGKSRSYCAPLM
jgi:hypothetical protein